VKNNALRIIFSLLVAASLLATHTALAQTTLTPNPDQLLGQSLQAIREARLDRALGHLDTLIHLRPDFRLAHIIRGDVLLARAKPLSDFADGFKAPKNESLEGMRDEARARLMRYIDQPDPGLMPSAILQLAPEQRYALLADASRSRIYLFENIDGTPRLLHDHYLSIGRKGVEKRIEGDLKTPLGVYHITSEKDPKSLTDFYGSGAFPINYPNTWDASLGRSGHGIWLHGVPSSTYSRPPRASEGCMVVTNPDLDALRPYIQPGITPIIISERVEWLQPDAWQARRNALLDHLKNWETAWETRDDSAYINHYSDSLRNRRGWTEARSERIRNKAWIKLDLSHLALFTHPEEQLAVASFVQDYRSDRVADRSQKTLYLKTTDAGWKIALEQSSPLPPVEPNVRLAQRQH